MLFTRPRRRVVFGTIAALMVAAVAAGVLWRRSPTRYLTVLGGTSPALREGEQQYYTYGLTEWLVVYPRDQAGPRYHVDPFGLVPAVAIIVVGAFVCVWSYHRLVGRLKIDGYCDWCGYDLRGTPGRRCPECGRGGAADAPT